MWVRSSTGQDILLFSNSKLVLVPTQPSVPWVPGSLTPGIKRPANEGDQSPQSIAENRNRWSFTSTPHYIVITQFFVKPMPALFFWISRLCLIFTGPEIVILISRSISWRCRMSRPWRAFHMLKNCLTFSWRMGTDCSPDSSGGIGSSVRARRPSNGGLIPRGVRHFYVFHNVQTGSRAT
jgi:hypothetical protein